MKRLTIEVKLEACDADGQPGPWPPFLELRRFEHAEMKTNAEIHEAFIKVSLLMFAAMSAQMKGGN